MYFISLPFLVCKIFTFYINDVLLFKCPFPGSKHFKGSGHYLHSSVCYTCPPQFNRSTFGEKAKVLICPPLRSTSFRTQQVLGWICAVLLYVLTHNQQFRRSALNIADLAVTLQMTLLIFHHWRLVYFANSLYLWWWGSRSKAITPPVYEKNVSDINIKNRGNVIYRNIEKHSCIRCCLGKAIIMKYYDCGSVYYYHPPGRQISSFLIHYILSSVACLTYQIFPRHLINVTLCGKKIICFDFRLSSQKISHSTKKQARYDHKCTEFFMKCSRYFCQIYWNLQFLIRFSKNPPASDFMKIRPVGVKLFGADKQA